MHGSWREPTVTVDDSAPTYRVRIWTASDGTRVSWMIDDWELDTGNVDDALLWARKEADGRIFELFVRPHRSANYVRLLGRPADDVPATKVIPLSI